MVLGRGSIQRLVRLHGACAANLFLRGSTWMKLEPSLSWISSISASASTKRTWIRLGCGICFNVLHDGPCSPAKMSQHMFSPTFDPKWIVQASLMFAIVSSLSVNGTNSRGPTRAYFCALPVTSALKRCTVSSSVFFFSGPFAVFLPRHRFCFIASLNAPHAWSAMMLASTSFPGYKELGNDVVAIRV